MRCGPVTGPHLSVHYREFPLSDPLMLFKYYFLQTCIIRLCGRIIKDGNYCLHAKQTLHATSIMIQAIVGDISVCDRQLHKSTCDPPNDVITERIKSLQHASLESLSLVIAHGAPTRAIASSALRSLCANLKFTIRQKKVAAKILA